jgi:hypothetical protein
MKKKSSIKKSIKPFQLKQYMNCSENIAQWVLIQYGRVVSDQAKI